MIAAKFQKAAVNVARSYYRAEFGPIPGSTWEDISHAVSFETADPATGYWCDPEGQAWSDAWDENGDPVNHCGEMDHARRLTAAMDYARLHFCA
jgi:hypothetical protein